MDLDRFAPGSGAPYIAIAVIVAAVALSLAWLQVEGVVLPAASDIVRLGIGATLAVVALRVLELWLGSAE